MKSLVSYLNEGILDKNLDISESDLFASIIQGGVSIEELIADFRNMIEGNHKIFKKAILKKRGW